MNRFYWKTLLVCGLFAAFCSTSSAQITGVAKLDGKAPEMKVIDMSGKPECANMHPDPVLEETVVADPTSGALKNVVVSIKHDDPAKPLGDGHKLTTPALLSQRGCVYVPHVLAVMVGQPMKVANEDDCNHNVHSLAQNNDQFNFAQPTKDPGKDVDPAKDAEIFPVKCDVHSWMSAWVAVFDHPYFAVTGDDGTYSIDTAGLPDGDYTLTFWQEKYGPQDVKVTVKDHKGKADCSFKPEAADATPLPSRAPQASSAVAVACPLCTK